MICQCFLKYVVNYLHTGDIKTQSMLSFLND